MFNGTGKKIMKGAGMSLSSLSNIKPQGNLDTIPCDFLIDENGVIVDLHLAKDVNDFLEWERIEAFIPRDCRCTCNSEDCLSKSCRENCEKRIEASKCDGIFCG